MYFTTPDSLVLVKIKVLPKYLSARKMGETQNHFHCDTSSIINLNNFSAYPDQILVFPSFFTMESHLIPWLGESAHRVKISCNSNYPWKLLECPHEVQCLLVILSVLLCFSRAFVSFFNSYLEHVNKSFTYQVPWKVVSHLYCWSGKHLKLVIRSFHGFPPKTLPISGLIESSAWVQCTNNDSTAHPNLYPTFYPPPLDHPFSPFFSSLPLFISAEFNLDKSIADIMKISIEGIFSRNIYKPICLNFFHHNIILYLIALICSFIHSSHKYFIYTS